MAPVDYDSTLNETRTDVEQSETPAKFRVKHESLPDPYRGKLQFAIARGYAMSPRKVCEMFGVGRATVHNALAVGTLPGFRLGREWRIRPENIPVELAAYWVRMRKATPEPLQTELPTGELVYFLQGAEGFVKIGYTQNLAKRVRALQCGCPAEIELLAYARGGPQLERAYHRKFAAWRGAGEWFRLCPAIRAEIEQLNDRP
jgi:excisionase family DNA binding protein